jgi:hypothetical protein
VAKKGEERWYSTDAAESWYYKDPALFLRRLCTLMKEADLLLSRYSIPQIKQGFWCFITAFELPDLLEERSLDFSLRAQAISAVEGLYQRLFRRPGFEKIAFMYWDPLCYPFFAAEKVPMDEDHLRVQEAMFQTLKRLLNAKERISFLAAAHGLGHLRHPRGPEAIRDALASRGDLLEGDDAYAQSCIRGEMDAGPGPRLL